MKQTNVSVYPFAKESNVILLYELDNSGILVCVFTFTVITLNIGTLCNLGWKIDKNSSVAFLNPVIAVISEIILV